MKLFVTNSKLTLIYFILRFFISILRIIGEQTCKIFFYWGLLLFFVSRVVYCCFTSVFYFRQLFSQIFKLGYLSLPIVALTAIFTGAVLTLQSYIGFSRFNIESAIPGLVVISITRELGPVLIGLIFAGRVGAGICAELSSMRVTEQIDALPTLYTDPFKYLIFPRVMSGIICLPLLIIIGDIVGVYGGYLVGVYTLDFNQYEYIDNTIRFLDYKDIFSGLIKALAFGFTVTVIGCYYGYYCNSGAQGVGIATTKSVVVSSILILILNYIITSIFFS